MLSIPNRQIRAAEILSKLKADPPRCVLLEGGSEAEREQMALVWAAMLNCGNQGEDNLPCLECETCTQIGEHVFRDLHFLDDREEDPKTGTIKRTGYIKIDAVREVRAVMGEPPRGNGHRVVVLFEGQNLTAEAANSLLKYMEEPRPGNVFVLTAPQRERLLPTLISRSWVVTLAWPDTRAPQADDELDEDISRWTAAYAHFLKTGTGWFSLTGERGRVTRPLVERVIVELQRELAKSYAGQTDSPTSTMFSALLNARGMRLMDLTLDQAKQSLDYHVNPVLIMEWMAVNVRTNLKT